MLALALGCAFQLASPLVLRRAVDSLRGVPSGREFAGYAAAFAGLAVLQAGFKFLSRQVFLGESRNVEYELRRDYFARLLRLPAARLEAGQRGDFVSRATNDLQDVRLFLGVGVLNFLQTLMILAAAVVFLWRLHPGLTAVALSPFPLVSWLAARYSPRLHRRYFESNRSAGVLAGLVQEAISGQRTVRAYAREDWQRGRFEDANRDLQGAEVAVARISATLFPGVGFLAGLGHVAVLGFGGALVARGGLTLGSLVAFNAYLAMLTWPMIALGWTLSLAQRGGAALSRVREVLESRPEPAGAERPSTRGGGVPCLEARGVSFRYDGAGEGTGDGEGAETLSGVSLALPEGGYWGLVGATGSGKSTVVALLARLRPPGAGALLFHGAPLPSVAAGDLRTHVAVAPQDDFFFSGTIAQNVLLGRPRDDRALGEVLRIAGLEGEVAAFPAGAETPVGEGGVTLSGGQRQRLSVARALYGEPRTLILDGSLSSLDAETARRVLGALRAERPDLGLLVVSHRGAELDDADGVWFLRGGRITASGRHRDLLESDPDYLRLYREEELRRELEGAFP